MALDSPNAHIVFLSIDLLLVPPILHDSIPEKIRMSKHTLNSTLRRTRTIANTDKRHVFTSLNNH
ncbi:hypothetical protein AF72_06825 [Xylella taiwanensis]|uniref:Uncharacterized protein n=1 Tax=Xylella taiwanensis TaxID=1444770 RepID=Z9JK45_9GAMM|nr:hypothetical protein AB672_07355 [Xylella taiwanensis]EWS78211.1 hypothetical protein AF72_06825 [Xylella taiwanensis]